MSTYATVIELGGARFAMLSGPIVEQGKGWAVLPGGPVALLHSFGVTEFYRHGWNSWSPTGWRRLDERPLRVEDNPQRLLTADDAATDSPHEHAGSAIGALTGPDGHVLLLGALGLGSPRVTATTSALTGTVDDDEADAGWFLAYGEEAEVFSSYADRLAQHLGSRRSQAGAVWCSWYSCYDDVSQERIARIVDGLRSMPFDVVQIDDGWERSVGDWEANERFPDGMAAMAERIRSAGFRPGLWLAPLIALPDSSFARERPDLLVHDEAGAPIPSGYNWGGPYYSLDTTQPEVQTHLRELFTRIVGWGYTYLKLDFMYAGAIEGHRSSAVHRERAYRDALALIRETVGDEVYLLGCGVPILPSVGLLDGARVGPDVAAFWDNLERPGDPSGPGAKNALVASLNRFWLGRLFQADPDVAYARSRRSLLDDAQRAILRDLAAVLGFKSTSDPVAWLDEHEADEFARWLRLSETVRRTGRYTFEIDGRAVDFEPFIHGTAMSFATTVN
ncbi:MAG: alpha-galactosidase [Microbacterium sp.]